MPRIPAELKKRPFLLSEARAAGLSRRELAGKSWRRMGSWIYCWAGARPDALQVLQAWHKRLPIAKFIGFSAAWLYHLDVDPIHPAEVAVHPHSGVPSRPGLNVHRGEVESQKVRGLPAATLSGTMRVLRKRLSRVEYLVLADAALKLGLGRFDELAEPAESPMETRLRWLLINSGLPHPEVQTTLSFGRADLYYPQANLVIEYDGANHRDRLVEDNRRQNFLLDAGFKLLRFTASDLAQRPETIVAFVRDAVIK